MATVTQLSQDLSIEHFYANTTYLLDKKTRHVSLVSAGEERSMKLQYLKQLCSILAIKVIDCACVGDGENDLDLFTATGHGITFESSSNTMKEASEHTITSLSDLKNIF